MTKVRVLSSFHDRADYSRVYVVGQVIDIDDEARVRSIVEHGLGEIVETEPRPVAMDDGGKEGGDDTAVKTGVEERRPAVPKARQTGRKRKP